MTPEQQHELEYIQQLATIMRTQGVVYFKSSKMELTVPEKPTELSKEPHPFTQQNFKEAEMPISMAMWGT
jgi:hypothetical protein